MNEDRLTNIEIKIAHQENLIEELNEVVYKQQQTIDRLETSLSTLIRRLKDVLSDGEDIRGPDEKPPHY